MSHLVSRFDGVESNLDIMITNRAYRILHSEFLGNLSEEQNELRSMFERTYAFNGVNLEREMRDNRQLLKEYLLVWETVSELLRTDKKYSELIFGSLENSESLIQDIVDTIPRWKDSFERE